MSSLGPGEIKVRERGYLPQSGFKPITSEIEWCIVRPNVREISRMVFHLFLLLGLLYSGSVDARFNGTKKLSIMINALGIYPSAFTSPQMAKVCSLCCSVVQICSTAANDYCQNKSFSAISSGSFPTFF